MILKWFICQFTSSEVSVQAHEDAYIHTDVPLFQNEEPKQFELSRDLTVPGS